jgi:hypothetical protein
MMAIEIFHKASTYVDESIRTDRETQQWLCCVTAYVASFDSWIEAEREWQSVLDSFAVSESHLTDFLGRKKEFKNDWSDAKRNQFMERLCTVAADHSAVRASSKPFSGLDLDDSPHVRQARCRRRVRAPTPVRTRATCGWPFLPAHGLIQSASVPAFRGIPASPPTSPGGAPDITMSVCQSAREYGRAMGRRFDNRQNGDVLLAASIHCRTYRVLGMDGGQPITSSAFRRNPQRQKSPRSAPRIGLPRLLKFRQNTPCRRRVLIFPKSETPRTEARSVRCAISISIPKAQTKNSLTSTLSRHLSKYRWRDRIHPQRPPSGCCKRLA